MPCVYIGVGSNLGNPQQKARAAVTSMAQIANTQLTACSSLYCSRPMGPQDQPDYMNAVVSLQTELSAEQLLDALQRIELDEGRERKAQRWGPRTLDLDILLYGDEVIDTPRLTVPHYGMKQREFVLLPLAEIAPQFQLPCGSLVSQLAANIETNGLVRYQEREEWLGDAI